MSSRSQSLVVDKYGGAMPPEIRRERPTEYNGYISKAGNYKYHHHTQPDYYTSLPNVALTRNPTTNAPSSRPPPVPTILTSTSFDSATTKTIGNSPRSKGRETGATSATRRNGNTSSKFQPTISKHQPPYPSSYPVTTNGYSSSLRAPPPNRNVSYHESYYHPTSLGMLQGPSSDPYIPHHHTPHYNGQPYYPYFPPWHHYPQTRHEPAISPFPTSIVPSSSVINNEPPLPVVYVTELGENDVLSGRGGATNSYRGNRAFRQLVKEYQDRYLRAKKRDKPAVASLIVETIRKRGGRFLRRDTNQFRRRSNRNDEYDGHGGASIVWVDIGDERAREKTCQALREGAPELRRQGHRNGDDEDRNLRWTLKQHDRASFDDSLDRDEVSRGNIIRESKNSRMTRLGRHNENQHHGQIDVDYNLDDDSILDDHTPAVRNGGKNIGQDHPVEEITFSDEEDFQIFIRPWSKLLIDRPPVSPIGLDQLSADDRDQYLRDFVPPNPGYERKRPHNRQTRNLDDYRSSSNESPVFEEYLTKDSIHTPDKDKIVHNR